MVFMGLEVCFRANNRAVYIMHRTSVKNNSCCIKFTELNHSQVELERYILLSLIY